MTEKLRIVVLGLSLTSSWGNGHATTYRALLRALAARGHDIVFLERDVPWYACERDLPNPDFCELHLYDSLDEVRESVSDADVVIVGSFVPDGIAAIDLVQRIARGVVAFYDIDTPVTLASFVAGDCAYLAARQIAGFDLYLSFTGGPLLKHIQTQYGAKSALALYCSVDPEFYHPTGHPRRWDLGYLGTYSADRQPTLERLLIEPARQSPERRFVVAGPQYPDGIDWPDNVERLAHVSPADHAEFYSSMAWTLNVTRADMIAVGYSPSVRLFEAASCGTPIISDRWEGLDSVLKVGSQIVVADASCDIMKALAMSEEARAAVATAARNGILREHTADRRALELEERLFAAQATKASSIATVCAA